MAGSFAHRLRLVAFVLGGLGLAACPAHADGPTGTFAVVSDIHFDPFDPPTLAKALAATDTGDWGSRFAGLAAQVLSNYGKDTNYALLASSLTAIAGAAAKTDFVIIGGDLLAHDFQANAGAALGVPAASKTVDAFTERTAIFVGDALRRALPGKPIIVALGNNDADCGDYRIEPGGPYLIATRELVRGLAGAGRVATDFDETYTSGGYYAVRHPTVPGTLILVLNDILWSAEYENACGSTGLAAADGMMTWLRDRLADQRAAGGHV
jgi:sphingomyelin phosphodiesterase acid-like 3